MLVSMCRALGADRYVSNPGARAYIDEEAMAEAGIRHCWQKFVHPVYEQGAPYLASLSVIDLLFNVGPAGREIVISSSRAEPGPHCPSKPD